MVRLPDGSEGDREYIRHPGAVAIVALIDDGQVLLERQYRYPLRREFIEIPAGKLEPGEAHLETAKRELLEETGYVAAGVDAPRRDPQRHRLLRRAHRAAPRPQADAEGERKLDAGEFLEVFTLPFDEAVGMVRDGRITDVKTVAAILWVKAFLP